MGIETIPVEHWPVVPFEVKTIEETKDLYKFNGYASIFDTPDLVNDVVTPGAFDRTMNNRGSKGFTIVFMHNREKLLGQAQMRPDTKGWYVDDGVLTKGVQLVDETYLHMKAGVIDGMSFAYRVVKSDIVGKLRHLKELAVSEVTLGPSSMIAHPDALVTSVKTLDALAAHTAMMRGGLAKPPDVGYSTGMNTDGLVKMLERHTHSMRDILKT